MPERSSTARWLPVARDLCLPLGLVALVAASWGIPSEVYDNSTAYLPLHIALETLGLIGACLIFAIGWMVSAQERSIRETIKASAFLAVALLNLGHLLSVPGMPRFVSPSSYEKGIVFWIAERLLSAGVLLWASLNPERPLAHPRHRVRYLIPFLAFAAAVYWATLYHEADLPRTFQLGHGPTALKVGLALGILALNLAAAFLYWRGGERSGNPRDARLRAYGSLLMGLGEVYFTQYRTVTSLTFVLGHVFNAAGLFLFAWVLFASKFVRPYAALAESRSALQSSETKYRLIADNMRDLVMTHRPDGCITFASPSVQDLLGYRTDELLCQTFDGIVHPDDLPAMRERIAALAVGEDRAPARYRLRTKDGLYHWFETVSKLVRGEAGEVIGFQSTSRDISERMSAERQIHRLAYYDSLTGLPNRYMLQDQLHRCLAQCATDSAKLAVLFLDLDHFKSVNDSLGHPVGDRLLQIIARRLSGAVRSGDVVARMGGDEFVLLLPGTPTPDGARRLAQKLLQAVSEEMLLEGHDLQLTASIGICFYPDDGPDPETLLKNADAAMYQAKLGGRNTYQFFTPELGRTTMERVTLEGHLRRALEREEFALHYQPQLDLRTGRVIGAEALLRWTSPELGPISPARFIPVAEETGLILPIGTWVLQTACRQARAWQDEGREIRLAINLSPLQFRQPDLLDLLDQQVTRTGVDPRGLELEITESVLMEKGSEMVAKLVAIQERGFCLSIDDFGTGFSSLAYLKHFPLDRLKIDQSFVRDLLSNPADALITQGIVALGHSLQAQVIAEGVEQVEQREMLLAQGCDEIQGYLIARPMPAGEFQAWLVGHESALASPRQR